MGVESLSVDSPRVRKPRGEARRTDSSTLNHVADGESLDRLVLWSTPRTVGAADWLDVTSSLFVATAVVALLVADSLISVWEAYLDARFLTIFAVLENWSVS